MRRGGKKFKQRVIKRRRESMRILHVASLSQILGARKRTFYDENCYKTVTPDRTRIMSGITGAYYNRPGIVIFNDVYRV